MRSLRTVAALVCATALLNAQTAADGLREAQAMDQEIHGLSKLPAAARERAIRDLAIRVRRQPEAFAVTLAFNLSVDGVDGSERGTLQDVADTLADVIAKSAESVDESAYVALAALVRSNDLRVTLADRQYDDAVAKLEAADRRREQADFSLVDLQGRTWNLKQLRGHVVVVNFWATWCPPCRVELPVLAAVQKRFAKEGLVVVSLTEEETSVVRAFVKQQKIRLPVLLDEGGRVKKLFQVNGIPQSFVYDRRGRIVAHAHSAPTLQGAGDAARARGVYSDNQL